METHLQPEKTLDCIGLYCPEPLFQTRESIDTLKTGDVVNVNGMIEQYGKFDEFCPRLIALSIEKNKENN